MKKQQNQLVQKNKASEELNFGELDSMIGVVLQRTFATCIKYLRSCMWENYKPGFYTTLMLIKQNPGLTQKNLADAIRRDKSTLVPFLNHMEKAELAIRKQSASDRRAHELYLTEKGTELAGRYHETVSMFEQEIEERMGSDDYKTLKMLLEKYDDIVLDFTDSSKTQN